MNLLQAHLPCVDPLGFTPPHHPRWDMQFDCGTTLLAAEHKPTSNANRTGVGLGAAVTEPGT